MGSQACAGSHLTIRNSLINIIDRNGLAFATNSLFRNFLTIMSQVNYDRMAWIYESLGYIRWAVHPAYARVGGRTIRGVFYYKLLQPGGRIA